MPDSTLKILRFGSCHFVMKDEIQNYEQILSRTLRGHLERGRSLYCLNCVLYHSGNGFTEALSQYMYNLCTMCPSQHYVGNISGNFTSCWVPVHFRSTEMCQCMIHFLLLHNHDLDSLTHRPHISAHNSQLKAQKSTRI